MKLIPLTQGKVAIVDDEDYGRLSQHKWYAAKRGTSLWYAVRNIRIDTGKYTVVYMHHDIVPDVPEGMFRDHINRNGLDNRRSNIRIVTRQQNSINCRKHEGASSSYRGVCWSRASRRWKVKFTHNRKTVNGKSFANEEDAAREYDRIIKSYRGDDAMLNFPEESS